MSALARNSRHWMGRINKYTS
jgi:hypothetical protein